MKTNTSSGIMTEGMFKDETDDQFVETKENTGLNVTSKEIPSKRKAKKESGKRTRIKKNRAVHKTKETTGRNKEHCCWLCPLTTADLNVFMDHVRTAHKNIDCLHRCEKCRFWTSSEQQLFEHRHIHMDFLLRCEKCSKGFNKQVHLDGHILTHHPELKRLVKSKVLSCEACGYNTVHKSNWLRHSCPQVYCDECDYSTTRTSSLVAHKRRHKRECWMCNKKYTWRKEFERHMQSHEEEKEYERLIGGIDDIIKGHG